MHAYVEQLDFENVVFDEAIRCVGSDHTFELQSIS